MRVLIAPDKFAGTMTALEAATALGDGWRRTRPDDEITLLPLADGGPGTVDAIASRGHGRRHHTAAHDPLGRPLTAEWWATDDGVAVVEVASTCGLHLLTPDERDPRRATSAGLGDVLVQVADSGVRSIVVGLGGTATVDGGAGAAVRLGARCTDADGRPWSGADVVALAGLDAVTPIARVLPPVRLASDVRNVLLGRDGAAHVFGPQKGAGPAEVEALETALRRLADVAERDLPGGPWRDRPAAGAAGGLGFGLMAWAAAEVVSGAELVGRTVGLESAIAGADVVVTGEGGLDAQTAQGKVPEHVRALARSAGRPVLVVAGVVEAGAADAYDDHAELGPAGLSDPLGRCITAGAELAGRAPSRRPAR